MESGEATTTLQGSGGQTWINVFCYLGNPNPANIYIDNRAECRARATFYNGSKMNYVDILRPESQTNGPKINLEEAQAAADTAIKKLDPDGQYALSTYGIAWIDDRSIESNEQADIDNASKAYVFEYMRQVNGIPATYTMLECASRKSMDETFTNPLSYECTVVAQSSHLSYAQFRVRPASVPLANLCDLRRVDCPVFYICIAIRTQVQFQLY